MRDLVIRVKNEPGALASVTAAISDAGVRRRWSNARP